MTKKIIKTETTLEGDRLRLEISSSGFSTIYRKLTGSSIGWSEKLDLLDFESLKLLLELLLEARQEGLLGPVPRAATSAELTQRGN